jgi:uncharacterized protein (DUF433 family)
MPNPTSTIHARIISDSAIHGGEPIIEGTSTPVRAVAELWNQGMPAEEIPVHLPHLHLVQVFEALRYYLTSRQEIDGYIEANRVPEGWSGKQFDLEKGEVA